MGPLILRSQPKGLKVCTVRPVQRFFPEILSPWVIGLNAWELNSRLRSMFHFTNSQSP